MSSSLMFEVRAESMVFDSDVKCCVFEVLERGSGGEDLAVFCRSVISYCSKRGVEVGILVYLVHTLICYCTKRGAEVIISLFLN